MTHANGMSGRCWTLCGTPLYMSPEMALQKGHGKPTDFWSLGVVIFELMAGDCPPRPAPPACEPTAHAVIPLRPNPHVTPSAGDPPFNGDDELSIYTRIIDSKVVYPKQMSHVQHGPKWRLGRAIAGHQQLL